MRQGKGCGERNKGERKAEGTQITTKKTKREENKPRPKNRRSRGVEGTEDSMAAMMAPMRTRMSPTREKRTLFV